MVFFSLLPYTTIFDAIQTASRKSTFWRWPLTEKCTLCGRRDGKAHSVRWPSRKSAFRVRAATQSAPFREGLQPECTFP